MRCTWWSAVSAVSTGEANCSLQTLTIALVTVDVLDTSRLDVLA